MSEKNRKIVKANELLIKKNVGTKLQHANPTGPYFSTPATGLSSEVVQVQDDNRHDSNNLSYTTQQQ